MPAATYFEHPLMPGVQHFECQAQRCTLSVTSCAAQYRRAKAPDSGSACRGCRLGAEHAGEKLTSTPRRLCCRCGRTDQRLVGGQVCVSCYNRQRELLVGRNGKGQFPSHARHVRPADVFVTGGRTIHVAHVADIAEAVLLALVRYPGAAAVPIQAQAPA